MKVPILTFLFLAKFCDSSPETEEKKNEEAGGNSSPPVPEGLCPLPKELGYSGILNSRWNHQNYTGRLSDRFIILGGFFISLSFKCNRFDKNSLSLFRFCYIDGGLWHAEPLWRQDSNRNLLHCWVINLRKLFLTMFKALVLNLCNSGSQPLVIGDPKTTIKYNLATHKILESRFWKWTRENVLEHFQCKVKIVKC